MAAKNSSVLDLEVHSAITTPLGVATTLYVAAMVASFWHHALAVDAIAFTAAMAVTLAATLRHVHPTVLIHLGVTAFASAGWVTWAQVASPFTARAAVPFAILLVLLGPMYWAATAADRRERRAALENASRLVGRKAARGDWPGMLAALGCPGIDVADTLESRAGYVKVLRLPAHGHVTYERIRGLIKQLEVVLDVQRGCVRVVPGETASLVQVHVVTRDVMAETIDLPDDDSLISVTDPIDIGVDETGAVFALLWREIATIIAGIRGKGKALALDTPLPTPTGWTTMGEIRAGDVLFDERGLPCRVTDAWDVRYGRPCYEVVFSDGSVIVADAEHQWSVTTRRSRMKGVAEPQTLTTEALIPNLRVRTGTTGAADRCENNYSVRVANALACPDASLPVPPYTLGAWLGDGWSATGAITTADPEILSEIESEGETVWIMPSTNKDAEKVKQEERTCLLADTSPCAPTGKIAARGLCINHWSNERRAGRLEAWPRKERDTVTRVRLAGYRVAGLKARLRDAGVLGDKHIPVTYLRASEGQRRALLAGLLDTDGSCTKAGAVEYYSTNERLARDVHHLVASLGYKPTLRTKTARLAGKDCGTAWTVAFTTPDKVFRLQRKVARQVISVRPTSAHRYITAIRLVESVPVRCIAVDSPSHQFLVGPTCIPTHNSNLVNVLIAQLSRCVDTVIWVIDLKGGRTARPWLEPWLAGRTSRPVIDWVATTPGEANLMLETALTAVQIRAHSGAGGEKIEPSAEQPAIIIICEEVATLVGMHADAAGKPRSLLMSVTQLGRSEAIDPILITQRNTVTMTGSGDLISQCPRRIALGVSSAEDARLITGETATAAAIAALRHPGSMYVRDGDVTPVPVKGYRVVFDRIAQLAERRSARRPGLEASLETALGEVYAKRWERAAHLVDGSALPQSAPAVSLPTRPAAAVLRGIPKPPADAKPTYRTGQGAVIPRSADKLSRDEVNSLFEDLAADLADVQGETVHPGRARMVGIIESLGTAGAGPTELTRRLNEDGFETARQTVHKWLNLEIAAGTVVLKKTGVYVHRTYS